jgi:signal transduction histidine kinase
MIRHQCNRLENLLRDFLRFARMRDLEMTVGSLNEQIQRVMTLYRAQADKSEIQLQIILDANLPNIKLHSDSLQAALLNLVKNALEAMPNGGQLLVRTYSVPGGVAMEMIDTGCGMDEVTAMRMFEPFYSGASPFRAKLVAAPSSQSNSQLPFDSPVEDLVRSCFSPLVMMTAKSLPLAMSPTRC